MFERNRIDNASHSSHQSAVAAEVTLTDGELLCGHFLISSARAITDVLNGETSFLEFETLEGACDRADHSGSGARRERQRRFIAKQAIRSVKLVDAPAAAGLEARRPVTGEFDPYSALGVKKDAAWDDIRNAYLQLAKAYHPDRYASVDLPPEVREYLQQMARRVNAAFTLLEAPRLVVRKADLRATPVYTSRPRA